MSMSPFISLFKTIAYWVTGKIRFLKDRIGQPIIMDDGREFKIFRQVRIEHIKRQQERPGATFIVRFHLRGMSPGLNKKFSLIPMLFILGLPGFRSKIWAFDESTGDFQGIYEWDTLDDAENYSKSFAMRFMSGRSVPGSISYKIMKNRQ
jgi:hypothetical protein